MSLNTNQKSIFLEVHSTQRKTDTDSDIVRHLFGCSYALPPQKNVTS